MVIYLLFMLLSFSLLKKDIESNLGEEKLESNFYDQINFPPSTLVSQTKVCQPTDYKTRTIVRKQYKAKKISCFQVQEKGNKVKGMQNEIII